MKLLCQCGEFGEIWEWYPLIYSSADIPDFKITLFSTRALTQCTQRGCAFSLLCSYAIFVIWSWPDFHHRSSCICRKCWSHVMVSVWVNSSSSTSTSTQSTSYENLSSCMTPVTITSFPINSGIFIAICLVGFPVPKSHSNGWLSSTKPNTGYFPHSVPEVRTWDIGLQDNSLLENGLPSGKSDE